MNISIQIHRRAPEFSDQRIKAEAPPCTEHFQLLELLVQNQVEIAEITSGQNGVFTEEPVDDIRRNC